MSDYRVFNDNGYERTWEELYEDNVRFQKYTDKLEKENKQLKEQLLVTQTNEETFRLEMEDITRALGLAEDTLFDDIKTYARSLKDNWNKLKEWLESNWKESQDIWFVKIINKMQELEQGSDSNEKDEILEVMEYHFKKIKKLCQIYVDREIDYKTGINNSRLIEVCKLIEELECESGRINELEKMLYDYDNKE